MKTINFQYLFLFVMTLGLLACKESRPVFKDIEGEFAIAFMNEPQKTVDTFQTELGEVVLYSFMEETSSTNAHMLTYSDYPVNDKYISQPYKFIDGAKEGALKSLRIDNIILDERIDLGGVPGVEVKGTNSQNLYIHYKLFLKGSRLYQIGLLKEGEAEESEAELEFMESFVFL